MRPTPFLRALPVLPPRDRLPAYFYTKAFTIVISSGVVTGTVKGKQPRTCVADGRLADQLVKSFRVKEGSTVLEGYPGLGYLTRSLLRSPSHIPRLIALEPSLCLAERALGFPSAIHGGLSFGGGISSLSPKGRVLGPIEGVEGARRIMRGAGARSDVVIYECPPARKAEGNGEALSPSTPPPPITLLPHMEQRSSRAPLTLPAEPDDPGEGRLTIVDEGIFHWSTFGALRDEGYLEGVGKRNWEDDDPPDLHFVCQVPDAEIGEQMVNQWIGCVPSRSWIFQYGRVKMSLVVTPSMYDRLMAPTSSKAYSKLSVIRQALFDAVPSSPNYPDSPMMEISAKHLKLDAKRKRQANGSGVPAWADQTHGPPRELVPIAPAATPSIHSEDAILSPSELNIYPPIVRSSLRRQHTVSQSSTTPERPYLMGITLIPKKVSPITAKNKDVWDYVVRRMFVLSGQKLEVAIANLGPGAKNLIPVLTDKTLPPERRIAPGKIVRELNVQDWANVVKAFEGWRFAPELLALPIVTTP